MRTVTNTVRIGMVRRRSISPEPREDQASSSVLQQTNSDLPNKYGGRRISRSAPLRDELPNQKHMTSVNHRPPNGINKVNTKGPQYFNMPASSSILTTSNLQTQTTTRSLNVVPSKSKWSTKKKIIVGVSIASAIAALIIVAVVLSVLFTRSSGTTTTTTATTTTTSSSTVIIAAWFFDNVVTDNYGVYNGQLMNGAGYSPSTNNQPYVGYGRALFMNYSIAQSFIVSTPFLDLTYKSFTIEAWIYSTAVAPDRGIFSQCQCSTCSNQCLFFLIRSTRLYAGFTLNDLTGTSILATNTWYHVAFVYNYQTQQQVLYLNGVQEAILSNAQPYQGTNGNIQIGTTQVYGTTNYFTGYIDNVVVTTRAKTASEILRDASLMAYYSFDLPNPTADSGPNGLTGTIPSLITTTGRVNNAIRFTSSTAPPYFFSYGFYQLPYGIFINKPFSVSLWINPSSLSTSTIVQIYGTALSTFSCLNLLGLYSTTGLGAQITVASIGSTSQPPLTGPFMTTNTWTHISVTYSLTNGYTLYVNGVLFGATGSVGTTNSNTLAYLFIGYYINCAACSVNGPYYGSIDEAYIHNRELTQADVTGLANP